MRPVARRRGGSRLAEYLELMEPRVLMTTVLGGESFQYTDAQGHTITATLTGSVAAELVSAVQAGGHAAGNGGTAIGGYLLFGNIAGKYTTGPLKGVIVGSGSLPINNGAQGSAAITIPNLSYDSPGDQINLSGLAANSSGQVYAFNLFNVDASGASLLSPTQSNNTWDMQVLLLSNTAPNGTNGNATVLLDITGDASNSLLSVGSMTANSTITNTYTDVVIAGAAFNPYDGQLYFILHDSISTATTTSVANGTNTATTTTVNTGSVTNEMYAFNPSTLAFTDIGAIDVIKNSSADPRMDITGMTFAPNATNPAVTTLYISEQPNGVGGPPNLNPAPQARILEYTVGTSGAFTITSATTTENIFEGYGSARKQLTTIHGLVNLPASFDGGGPQYLFAIAGTGSQTHMVRIDLLTGEGTTWGSTTDLFETVSSANSYSLTLDGQDVEGLTYNPAVVDPFTGLPGAWMTMDQTTRNLDFVDKTLRISQGDVYSVYSTVSNIHASIVFQGPNLYTGNPGNVQGAGNTPGNTGQAFLGFKGEIPDTSTNSTFVSSTPYLSGTITDPVGIMPTQIGDTTQPGLTGLLSSTLFAGLTVGNSYEETFDPTQDITAQVLSNDANNGFYHVSGLAIAPDGTMVVMNTPFLGITQNHDTLGFVDPVTGLWTGSSRNIHLGNDTTSNLRGVEAMAFGDPTVSGTPQLYAVYDLGAGPVLGTINLATGSFTPLGSMGLGQFGRVQAIAFSPGVNSSETLYAIADPNFQDASSSEILYKVNTSTGAVNNAPTYDPTTQAVLTNGGIAPLVDTTASGTSSRLQVTTALFDPAGTMLVLDRQTGRLLDVDLTTGKLGQNFTSVPGAINSTVTGLALDPNSLRYVVVDNFPAESQHANVSSPAAAIMMYLKDFTVPNTEKQDLGKFLFDGVVTGKITVPGSMDLLYAGDLITGNLGGTWSINAGDGSTEQVDFTSYNYFKDNIYIGGDVQNIVSLTNIGISGTNSNSEITVVGRIGAVNALGNMTAVVHASNSNVGGQFVDASGYPDFGTGYGFGFSGSAVFEDSEFIELTTGQAHQTGSVFGKTLQPVDGFNASFEYFPILANTTADGGFAFVLQNQGSPLLGGAGAGLGYSGIFHSLALEFNLDPALGTGGIALKTNGQVGGYTVMPNIDILDGILVSMTYSGTTLTVMVEDEGTLANFTKSYAINLANILGSHGAYVGFTGATNASGSTMEIANFTYSGVAAGNSIGITQDDLQHYTVDKDYSFATGYLVSNGNNAPFRNDTFATAQFLGTLRNAVSGQPDVIDVAGTLEAQNLPQNGASANTDQKVDFFAFGMLAGQTVDVTVLPRDPLANESSSSSALLQFGIYDPDGNLVASTYNFFSGLGQQQTLHFTADRPGAYRIAIADGETFPAFGAANTNVSENVTYELLITGQGVGSMGIGAVVSGGDMTLYGSQFVLNNSTTLLNPSIHADSGDVGVIKAGGNLLAPNGEYGLVQDQSVSQGYDFSGDSTMDILVSNGNLRALQGNAISTTDQQGDIIDTPDVYVSGAVGLMSSGGLMALTTSKPVGGNIQMISAAGDLNGVYATNKAIGVIRAGSVYVNGTIVTEFKVDADRQGRDGTIDYIDDSGNWGGTGNNQNNIGAPIVTGPGGNVRFMRVDGTLNQDSLFNNGQVSDNGQLVHAPGIVTYVDDSGGTITLDPGSSTTTATGNGSTGTMTVAGQITTRTYGIRGAGGVVILNVTSTLGLTVTLTSSSNGLNAEIGTIEVDGTGIPVTVTNGVPSVNNSTSGTTTGTTTTGNSATNVTLTSKNGGRLDALAINAGAGATIDQIKNDTPGDIFNITATDVGTITAHGNIGRTYNTTGTDLIGLNVFSNTYPFVNQTYGISVANLGTVKSDAGIGNIIASGVIGTITANADNVDNPNSFEGIFGPIVIQGTAAATYNTNTGASNVATASRNVSVNLINIGEGIAAQGSGAAARSGIFATGEILQVTGANADIRGAVTSQDSIGTITLTNGSIINAPIMVVSQWSMTGTFNNQTLQLPQPSTQIDDPVYVLHNINIQGNGGIIGSVIAGSSIDTVTVASSGFGILNTDFIGVTSGTINKISAGGYGLREVFIEDARVNSIVATGNGTPSALSNYESTVQSSLQSSINPYTNASPTLVDDLALYILGDGIDHLPDPYGLATGLLGEVTALGQDQLGDVTAYDIRDSQFTFPDATGNVHVLHDVDDTLFLTGTIKSVTVDHNATNFEVTAAGTIGPVKIAGDFTTGTNQAITSLSQIFAKGPNGNITSFVTNGNFAAVLDAEGHMGQITIGSASKIKGQPSMGDFAGTVTVGGNHLTGTVLDGLHVYGSVNGGTIDINGNANTIDIAHDFTGLNQDLFVRGNLANFIVGDDTAVNASVFSAPLTVSGSLTNATITGLMSGSITVGGGLGKLAINTDPGIPASTNLMTGVVHVAGSLTSATIQGPVSGSLLGGVIGSLAVNGALTGSIMGGKSITSLSISGPMEAGSSISSALGDIGKVTVSGTIDGSITAPNGALTSLAGGSSVGPDGVIAVRSLGALTFPGVVSGTISATQSFTSLKAGSIASTAYITAPGLGSITTTGDLGGVLNIGTSATALKIAVGGNYAATGTFGSPMSATVNGSMLTGSAMISTSNITSVAVKGTLSGQIISDRALGAISAASMSGAVIAGGLGLSSLTVTGAILNSLVETGLARGADQVFGTGDLGEQPAMADITKLSAGSIVSSVIAAGGNIPSLAVKTNMSSSIVTSGVVLGGAAVAGVLADTTPLQDPGEMDAAYHNSTLLRGTIKTAAVGTTGITVVNSTLAAGVSPGADDIFGTADDNTISSLTGGTSSITTFKGGLDGTSHLLADSVGGGAAVVGYTLDNGTASIVASDPVSGAPTATATTTTPAVIVTPSGTITITIKGAVGSTVTAYDNASTSDRLDTIVISGPANSPLTVTVTTTAPGTFDLGRILTTDNTQLSNFTFNGDLLGDVNGGVSLWIDSSMASFSVRNMTTDSNWNGVIGGDVGKLNIAQTGPGRLRIGGRVTTLTVAASSGNPLLQQLGTVNPATFIDELAYDPNSGSVSVSDGSNLYSADVNSGTLGTPVAIQTAFDGTPLTVSGLTYDSSGRLIAVSDINNQNPITALGQITTTGDTLRGLAVNSLGTIYAIDSQTGTDMLVTLDPTTGAETVLGAIRNFQRSVTYSNNILALAFDGADNLYAITNDADGTGTSFNTGQGPAYGRIDLAHPLNNSFNFGNPNANGLLPVLLNQTPTTGAFNLAIDPNTGTIYATRNTGGLDELDTLTVAGAGSLTTVSLNPVGTIAVNNGANLTTLAGIGIDEAGNLIGISNVGGASELIGIDTGDPLSSVRIDTPGLLARNYGGFAVGRSGDTFSTYGYTTDATTGGMLYVSPGLASSLGVVGSDGTFTEMLPLAQDSAGTALSSTARSIAIDSSGNIFTITSTGLLAEYSSADGSLIGTSPIGTVTDTFGNKLNITRIAFNGAGVLVGLNADQNNLVQIATTGSMLGGVNVAVARILTEPGTAISADLTALTYSTALGKFISYSSGSGNFVSILGTSPDSLGGLIANSFGSVSIPDNFSTRIHATGNGAGNSIDSIKFVGTGDFTGGISSVGSIGSIAGTGLTISGAIVTHGDMPKFAVTGSVTQDGVISVDGRVTSFALNGSVDGSIFAGGGSALSITGAVQSHGRLEVGSTLASLSIGQQLAGEATVTNVSTLKIGGTLASGSTFTVLGDAGNVSLGGVDLGGRFLADSSATSITVGGTLAGVVATRRSVGTVTINNASTGIFDVGGDINSLKVNGSVTGSVIAAGTWIGADGIYNTADDVIYGGGINTGNVTGTFSNSVITAGVLPNANVASGINHIPNSFLVYTSNTNSLNLVELDSAESGGIAPSILGTFTFSKPVVSSLPNIGVFSALVAADGIKKVTAKGALQQIVRSDPPGAPQIATTLDPGTGLFNPGVIRVSPNEVDVVFNEPIDTATIGKDTVSVIDRTTNLPVTDLTFGYTTQLAPDGSIEGVIQIFSNTTAFNGSTSLIVVLQGGPNAPTITDRTGLRSALRDYNQDGVPDAAGDPFGTTYLATTNTTVGGPPNDDFANAYTLSGMTVTTTGENVNATTESAEILLDSSEATVWWKWTAPSSGIVDVDTIGSSFDTVLGVFSGTNLANATLVGADDDSGGNLTSELQFQVTQGVTYYIQVGGYAGDTGNIVLNINETATQTATFQQGVNGYTGTVDTQLQLGVTDPSLATNDVIWLEIDPQGDGVRQVLFRFDNIFGNGPGQIPVGSTIISATMTLTTASVTGGPGPGGQFYRMLQPWNDTDTWDDWVDGIQANGIEAASNPTTQAGTGVNSPVVTAGAHQYDVTNDLTLFSLGAQNDGWVIIPWPGSTDGWGLYTSEAATVSNRPQLTVVYIPPTI